MTKVFPLNEFLREHHISRGLYYRLKRQGTAPRTMKVGRRILLSEDAIVEWRRRMEQSSGAAA